MKGTVVMKVEVKKVDSLKRELSFEVPRERAADTVRDMAREVSWPYDKQPHTHMHQHESTSIEVNHHASS